MTPLFAFVLALAFVVVLIGGALVLEETEPGRRFADRAIRWIVR